MMQHRFRDAIISMNEHGRTTYDYDRITTSFLKDQNAGRSQRIGKKVFNQKVGPLTSGFGELLRRIESRF